MSNKSKNKQKTATAEDDNAPYHHPVLEEQLIIRFPPDIAQQLAASMEDDDFQDFEITFKDKHYATVKIFEEVLTGVLVNLPTIVETHRTVDGSHLYKSADIGEMLIVYRQNDQPKEITADFVSPSGITPPTANIVETRRVKQENARSVSGQELNPIEGIEYWEMVEIQLSALISKEKNAKPITRHEFFLEPDIDPVTLEKVLRKHVDNEKYKGYSGKEIDDSELYSLNTENEPTVQIPQELIDEMTQKEGGDGGEEGSDVDIDLEMDKIDEEKEEDEPPKEESPEPPKKEEPSQSESSYSDYEEEEEEESKLESLKKERQTIIQQRSRMEELITSAQNEVVKNRYQVSVVQLTEKLAKIDAEISQLS